MERDYVLENGITEEPEAFRHATSLDRAVMHLIPTFQSHKGKIVVTIVTIGSVF
jgi:hypothetical protein